MLHRLYEEMTTIRNATYLDLVPPTDGDFTNPFGHVTVSHLKLPLVLMHTLSGP